MKKIINITLALLIFLGATSSGFASSHPVKYYKGPAVSTITTSGATLSIDSKTLESLSQEEKAGIYFEYQETQKACIMIYPTPPECLPKKTAVGILSVAITDLKPNTSYTAYFKKDNTIMCVTAPCFENGIQSDSTVFLTRPTAAASFTRNLTYRSRGADVVLLQDLLRLGGYFSQESTGYFGIATFKAVKDFQKNYMKIPPTGFVGSKTRAALLKMQTMTVETFEGTIQSVSTACFADGECSVTIDGKKVVTTIGWSQAVVGSIKGTVNSIGDIETSKIGARAKVYAQKIEGGYTLYGNQNFYIEVF